MTTGPWRRAAAPLALPTLLVLLAATVWLASAAIAANPRYGWDDSFITYQYGRNLSQGLGLRFNPSDAHPGEGYSSLLHVVVVALGMRFGADPLVLTRALSVVSLAALPLVLALPLAHLAGTRWALSAAAAAALQLFWLALPSTRHHLHLGMETFLFQFGIALLLAWSLLALGPQAETTRSRARRFLLCAAAAALVVIGRPEGVALVAVTFGVVYAARRFLLRDLDAPARRALTLQAALVGAGIFAYLAFKLAYFGYLLPNPYYVKSGRGVWGYAGQLLPGLGQLGEFLRDASPALAAGALLLWLGRAPRRSGLALGAALLPGVAMVLLYARALPEAAYHYRFLFPYLVHAQALLAGGVCLALAPRPRLQRVAPAVLGALAVLTVVVASPATRAALPHPAGWLDRRLENLPHPWWLGMLIGHDLAATGLGEKATVATSMAGAIPWFSGMRLIDTLGLVTDPLSGREPLTPEKFWRLVDESRPDVLVSGAPPATPGYAAGAPDPALGAPAVARLLEGVGSEIAEHADRARLREMVQREMILIRDRYALGAAYRVESGAWTFVYVRRDSPLRREIMLPLLASFDPRLLGDLARSYGNDPRALPQE